MRVGRCVGLGGSSAPGTGNVGAGPEIVVATQAIGAKVKLVNAALDDRFILSTTVADGFTVPLSARGCRGRRSDRSQSACLDVKPRGDHQHASCDDHGAPTQHSSVGIWTESGG